MESSLNVEGMHCKSCELLIEDSLKEIGVEKVFFESGKVKVFFDENKIGINQIKKAIRNEGYKVI